MTEIDITSLTPEQLASLREQVEAESAKRGMAPIQRLIDMSADNCDFAIVIGLMNVNESQEDSLSHLHEVRVLELTHGGLVATITTELDPNEEALGRWAANYKPRKRGATNADTNP